MSIEKTSRVVMLSGGDESVQLLGKHDRHFSLVEDIFAVRLIPKGHELVIEGPSGDVDAV